MSVTYKNHIILSSVENNGDINEIYPIVNASDVSINTNDEHSKNVSNLQELVNKIGNASFSNISDKLVYIEESDKIPKQYESDIDDTIECSSKSWSGKKIINYITEKKYGTNNTTYFSSKNISLLLPLHPYTISLDTSHENDMYCPFIYIIVEEQEPEGSVMVIHTKKKKEYIHGDYIVEYIPFIKNNTVYKAIQRWTLASAPSLVFSRIYNNNTWSDFIECYVNLSEIKNLPLKEEE